MTEGETLYLIGVIVAFVAFSAMLAYSQMTSGGSERKSTILARATSRRSARPGRGQRRVLSVR